MKFPTLTAIGLVCVLAACSSNKDSAPAGEPSGDDPTTKPDDSKAGSAVGGATDKPAPPPTKPAKPLPSDSGDHVGKLTRAVSFGGLDRETANSAAGDSKGSVIVGGFMKGKAKAGDTELTADGVDALIVKYDADGKLAWARNYGGEGDDTVESVATDAQDNIVAVGAFNTKFTIGETTVDSLGADDAYIAKFDSTGTRQWAKVLGGSNIDAAHQVAVDSQGNIVVTGVFRDSIDFGGNKALSEGDADIFITKLDADGNVKWFKHFGGRGKDYGRAVAFDSDDNLYFVCEFSRDIDFGGGSLSSKGNRDIAVAKYTKDGDHVWSKSYGNSSDLLAIDLAVDPSGSVIVIGSYDLELSIGDNQFKSAGQSDILLVKYGHDGTLAWAKSFGDKDEDLGTTVATDKFGNVFASGIFRGAVDFGGGKLTSKGKRDAFFVKFDPSGKHLWSKSVGGPEPDVPRGIVVDKNGAPTFVGTFYGEVDFGGKKLATAKPKKAVLPTSDIFVVSLER